MGAECSHHTCCGPCSISPSNSSKSLSKKEKTPSNTDRYTTKDPLINSKNRTANYDTTDVTPLNQTAYPATFASYGDSVKMAQLAQHNASKSDRSKFRAFVIARHPKYGFLLLKAYKKSKGMHYQLPGGRLDNSEIRDNGLAEASKIAAVRELFEETGIQTDTDRLIDIDIALDTRVYFELKLSDEDSLHWALLNRTMGDDDDNCDNDAGANVSKRDKTILCTSTLSQSESGEMFYLQLSNEHCGFTFESDIRKASRSVELHSNGYNKKALREYGRRNKMLESNLRKNSSSLSSHSYVSVSQNQRKDSHSRSKNKSKRSKKKSKRAYQNGTKVSHKT